MATPLIVPGLYGSCADHWQTWLEHRLPTAGRVLQANWERADLAQWADALEKTVVRQSDRVLLIAHSFGCLASAAAAPRIAERIMGALLVAPCDPQRFGVDERLIGAALPFPSMLVASRNDPWMSFPRARTWAERWSSRLVDAGYKGHINVASGHGSWHEALPLIAELSGNSDARVLRPPSRPPLEWAV